MFELIIGYFAENVFIFFCNFKERAVFFRRLNKCHSLLWASKNEVCLPFRKCHLKILLYRIVLTSPNFGDTCNKVENKQTSIKCYINFSTILFYYMILILSNIRSFVYFLVSCGIFNIYLAQIYIMQMKEDFLICLFISNHPWYTFVFLQDCCIHKQYNF